MKKQRFPLYRALQQGYEIMAFEVIHKMVKPKTTPGYEQND